MSPEVWLALLVFFLPHVRRRPLVRHNPLGRGTDVLGAPQLPTLQVPAAAIHAVLALGHAFLTQLEAAAQAAGFAIVEELETLGRLLADGATVRKGAPGVDLYRRHIISWWLVPLLDRGR